MIFGTLFVVVGAVLIGIYGIVPEPTHSLDDLLRLFGRTSFVVYFTLLGVAVVMILAAVSHIMTYDRPLPVKLICYMKDTHHRMELQQAQSHIPPDLGAHYAYRDT